MVKKLVKENVLELLTPQTALPVIFDSPHSGTIYPNDFDHHCDLSDLKRTEDLYVAELFANAPAYHAILLHALFPRAYIDANRAADDIDPLLLGDQNWPVDQYGSICPTNRSDSGIGLIPRLIKAGVPIYNRALTAEEIMTRVKTYHEPYHDALRVVLDDAYYNHGQYWHINCHSMPNSSAYPKRNVRLIGNMPKASDIVLGDLDGRTCNKDFMHALREFWENKGLRVSINDPFKGVELISKYAQPTRGKNSVQIEINRSLYMHEESLQKRDDFEIFKGHCNDMIQFCCDFALSKSTRIAAD